MITRRKFVQSSVLASAAVITGISSEKSKYFPLMSETKPVVISTWYHGLAANEEAWKVLSGGGRALDAVENGVKVSEADPDVMSVGYGGVPDRDGFVTLDACIMDEQGNAGSVAYLQNIMHPISVARKVMETTPHVMLAGDGALQFALDNGFYKEDLLTEKAKTRWIDWLKTSGYKPRINDENHDTIGMIAVDAKGNLSGACTTSGLPFKYHGRVGDSPIIGAGLYVDNEIGGAAATGIGEAVIKVCGSFLVVEYMRNGKTPLEACRLAVERLIAKNKKMVDDPSFQVGFIAINRAGETGAWSVRNEFRYALYKDDKNQLLTSEFVIK